MSSPDRFVLDASTVVSDDGSVVLGGSPLVVLRLTGPGASTMRSLVDTGTALPGSRVLVDRLLDGGLVHPRVEPGSGPPPGSVAVVIPALAPDRRDLESVVATRSAGFDEIIVVDDGSPEPIGMVDGAASCGSRRTEGRRQLARRVSPTDAPFVVFLDADTVPQPGWKGSSTTSSMNVSACRSRIRAMAGDPRACSPGTRPGARRWTSGRNAVGYGAALGSATSRRADRRPALGDRGRRRLRSRPAGRGGRRPRLATRRGRLAVPVRAGRRRLPPDSSTLRRWLNQRFRYGTSAAAPRRTPSGPVGTDSGRGWYVAAWLVEALVSPSAGAVTAAAQVAAVARKLPAMPQRTEQAIRLGGQATGYTGRALAESAIRAWWPAVIPLALVSRRVRRAVAVAIVAPR
ncbi:MAG: hypothetical protein R2715_15495 [Ilumatobacteraceae bacterium]